MLLFSELASQNELSRRRGGVFAVCSYELAFAYELLFCCETRDLTQRSITTFYLVAKQGATEHGTPICCRPTEVRLSIVLGKPRVPPLEDRARRPVAFPAASITKAHTASTMQMLDFAKVYRVEAISVSLRNFLQLASVFQIFQCLGHLQHNRTCIARRETPENGLHTIPMSASSEAYIILYTRKCGSANLELPSFFAKYQISVF